MKKFMVFIMFLGLILPAFASKHNYLSFEKFNPSKHGPMHSEKAWVVGQEQADQYGNMYYMYLACKMTNQTFVLKHNIYIAELNNIKNGYVPTSRVYSEWCL